MRKEKWIRQFADSYWTNGYTKAPWDIYDQFLTTIVIPGTILELACGNGLLLRYVSDLANIPLEPYGIDINPRAILEAKTVIFPERADSFAHADLRDGVFFQRRFDTILANPLYADPGYTEQVNGKIPRLHFTGGMRSLIVAAWAAVAAGGQLILWCYDGHFAEISPQLEEFRELLRSTGIGLAERVSGPVVFWASSRKPPGEIRPHHGGGNPDASQ
jgi:SAM-dependent methyltransferase